MPISECTSYKSLGGNIVYMKILIAPNAFKGSLPAQSVARSMAAGIRRVLPSAEIIELPIADGGDGTLELIIGAAGGQYVEVGVLDPFAKPIVARFGILPDNQTAIIEMATASGLRLVLRDQLNPMQATTYGTGQLIRAALDHGCSRIIIGVGGSATVDGGIGMAQALGVHLLDMSGQPVGYGGHGLGQIDRIDLSSLDPRIHDTEIIVASDVENPLIGPEGAAAVFGPQKGATPDMVKLLDSYLTRYGEIIRRDVGANVLSQPSMGAAGGITAALVVFLGARIESGADVILDLMDVNRHLEGADLVFTGEGRLDSQTIYGKGPIAIAARARQQGIPVIALAGCLSDDVDAVYEHGIGGLMSIIPCPMTLDDAMSQAAHLIESAALRAMRLIQVGMSISS